jgi:TolB-like protein
VYIKHNKPNYKNASIMVLNFKEPDYAKAKGNIAGIIFHKELLKSQKFHMVELFNNSTWYKYAKTEEEQIKIAIEKGKENKSDYIFIGNILEYIFGGLNKTRVKIRARVIECKTGITLFMCEYTKTNLGEDKSYPMSTKMTDFSTIPQILLIKMAKDIVDKL